MTNLKQFWISFQVHLKVFFGYSCLFIHTWLTLGMATHSSVLAWRIPGTGEPGGLPSMGSHRVGHDWSDLAAEAAAVAVFVTNLELLAHTWKKLYFKPFHRSLDLLSMAGSDHLSFPALIGECTLVVSSNWFLCVSGVGVIESGPEFAQLDGTSKLNSWADLMFAIQKRAVGHRD